MYRIGLFSKMSKTTIKALHYYDEIDLLKPVYISPQNGYRYYSGDQLLTLHKINSFKQIGLSIEQIASLLKGQNVQAILITRKNEILAQIANNQEQLAQVNSYLSGVVTMNYHAVIKDIPECLVFAKRMTIPNHQAYFTEIPKLGQELAAVNPHLKCAEPNYAFVIYHDGEYKEQNIDIEYCEAVETVGTEINDVVFKYIEGIKAVTVLHQGPYSTLAGAYSYAIVWAQNNGYEVSGLPRESYIDGIWNKSDEKEWLTEIQIPVKKQ